MVKQLKLSFFQTFSITFVWILVLFSVFLENLTLTIPYIWNLVGISAIFAVILGIMYPTLWGFSSMKAIGKITISSAINIAGGVSAVWLFSPDMFEFIKPWLLAICVMTVLGHVIGFYFYSKWHNQKSSQKLNELLKNKL
ncbi:hypothetical protein CD798_01580 [Bacillaceae bacterium SAOS 7]|nr:hypothetical protein CEW92_02345 [Bacillaceae bacterium SAS-127]PAQ16430.1 hypothetical protein CD798_01580 [Bacillaceae bacterium SAOS 7]